MLERVEQWHNKWCNHLDTFMFNAHGLQLNKPSVQFVARKSRTSGRFYSRQNMCLYYLQYPLMVGNEYEETVMHEVCHSAAHQIFPSADWHGDFFKYLTRRVCGFANHTTKHHYNTRKANLIVPQAKLLILHREIQQCLNNV